MDILLALNFTQVCIKNAFGDGESLGCDETDTDGSTIRVVLILYLWGVVKLHASDDQLIAVEQLRGHIHRFAL